MIMRIPKNESVGDPTIQPHLAKQTLELVREIVCDPINTLRTHSEFHVVKLLLTHYYMMSTYNPKTHGESFGNPHCVASMDKEYRSLMTNKTWDLVPIHQRKILI